MDVFIRQSLPEKPLKLLRVIADGAPVWSGAFVYTVPPFVKFPQSLARQLLWALYHCPVLRQIAQLAALDERQHPPVRSSAPHVVAMSPATLDSSMVALLHLREDCLEALQRVAHVLRGYICVGGR